MSNSFPVSSSPPRLRLSRASHFCGGMTPLAQLVAWLACRGESEAACALRRLPLPPSCRVAWTIADQSLQVTARVAVPGKMEVQPSVAPSLGNAAEGRPATAIPAEAAA